MAAKMEDSPVIEGVLAVRANFKRSGVDPGGIEDSRKFSSIIALNGTVDREGSVVGVTKTSPGATAGPAKVGVTVWVNASPVGPGDDPAVAENVVVSVKGGWQRTESSEFPRAQKNCR